MHVLTLSLWCVAGLSSPAWQPAQHTAPHGSCSGAWSATGSLNNSSRGSATRPCLLDTVSFSATRPDLRDTVSFSATRPDLRVKVSVSLRQSLSTATPRSHSRSSLRDVVTIPHNHSAEERLLSGSTAHRTRVAEAVFSAVLCLFWITRSSRVVVRDCCHDLRGVREVLMLCRSSGSVLQSSRCIAQPWQRASTFSFSGPADFHNSTFDLLPENQGYKLCSFVLVWRFFFFSQCN